MERIFSKEGISPFDEVKWERRTAEIKDAEGNVIFKQDNVYAPKSWSVLATNVVASKYFYGELGADERENSVQHLIKRVCRTITDWGSKDGYFKDEDFLVFQDELEWLCLNQYASFNSPVWFNVGVHEFYDAGKNSGIGNWAVNRETWKAERCSTQYERPQCSACFIQSVEDNMESIMDLARSEAMLFKHGSGTGTDLTTIRSSREKLSGGGKPSGPLSFLKVYDQVANVVKSGGKTRRAAKMNTLRDWHGDIEEFIEAKQLEEKKAWALIDKGYDGSYNGTAYGSVMYQNENLSVRVSDEFMQAARDKKEWWTRGVTGGCLEQKDAATLLRKIAEGTWLCGDPGLQFDKTIQKWHTCKATDDIHSTNPCSEFVFLNDTACNLASLNLMKFMKEDSLFDVDRFQAAVRILITAQDILVDNASYPTAKIAENSHRFRPLGLGYANLGALLMHYGLPYDSPEAREFSGCITSLMTGTAYEQSAVLAQKLGAFKGFYDKGLRTNGEAMLEVIDLHMAHRNWLKESKSFSNLKERADLIWTNARALGESHGFRNSQVTVIAPTGTIAFMMDCDTTGIEPDIALVKYKLLAGGGTLKIVNQTVPKALKRFGYLHEDIEKIVGYIEEHDTIEGCPELKSEHLPVFDCAFRPAKGKRSIHYMGHLNMMAAVQPFISGAISKTVNMPKESTVKEIEDAYVKAWEQELKCVAIYRDGSKRSQPLSTSEDDDAPVLQRRRLPDTRKAKTHKFDVAGHEGYLTVGLFEDGSPGELFVTMAKEGSTIGGLMDTIGTLTSMALQYGVPLPVLAKKFAHQRFEPSGFTKNPAIRNASSITDYVFRWLDNEFGDDAQDEDPKLAQAELTMPGLEEEVKKKLTGR
ncbi:MAG: Vitamin B12-dependent ribonucleotide reductase [Verrucomicrobia subdivision 3 bacterium]|nr:Vitamin B12-dependent ribonucleotide reductase [Limisphaerales bacterium]MCS1415121.1 Vitamin B12-dependent ribonucleotide reductase [Limisphaerales bacterium]